MTVFMGLPIVSISLFLVAGIAIGYLVWFRDRTEDDKRILELEERYAAANGAAEMHRQEFLEAKKALNIQGSDLEQFRLLKTDIDEATQDIRAELAAEVSRSESLTLQLQESLAAGQSAEDLQARNKEVIREAGDELGRQTEMMERQTDEIEELKRQLADASNNTLEEELNQQTTIAKQQTAIAKQQTAIVQQKTGEIEELKQKLEVASNDSAAEELAAQLRDENAQLQSQIDTPCDSDRKIGSRAEVQ